MSKAASASHSHRLRASRVIDVGLSDHQRILATISMADNEQAGQRLLSALEALINAAPGLPEASRIALPDPSGLELESVELPRDAFFAAAESVPIDEAVGRVAAEQITPYPPGIPAVLPGERLTAEVLDYLSTGLRAGMVLPDSTDPTLATIRVTTK